MRLLYLPKELREHLKPLRPLLSKGQLRHLRSYLTGLMASKSKSVRAIARSCLGEGDQSSLNRFLHSKAWSAEALSQALLRQVWKGLPLTGGSTLLLIVDDTLLEKFGRRMELVDYLYSPREGRHILCHDIVTSHMLVGDEGYPVDLRLYARKGQCRRSHRRFRSRVELAVGLIEAFRPPRGVEVIALLDSWYLCRDVVDAIKGRGWHYIAEAKSNRITYYKGGKTNPRELASRLRHRFRDVEAGGDLYAPLLLRVEVPKLGWIALLMESRLQEGRDPVHFLVNDLDWPSQRLLEAFRKRHRIEEFYRDAKQCLGPGGYMVRSAHASNRHWRLVFLAYTLLTLLRRGVASLVGKTIGEFCEWVYEKCVEGLTSRLYRQFKAGATLEEALKNLQTAKL
jgi:hypothetical protein